MFGVCAQWEGRDHRAVQPISRVRSHWNQPWERCSVCRDETDHCVRTSSVEMWTNSEQKTDLDNSDNKIIFDYFDRRWSGETCWGLCRTNALSYICRAEFVGKTGQNSKGQDRTGQDRTGQERWTHLLCVNWHWGIRFTSSKNRQPGAPDGSVHSVTVLQGSSWTTELIRLTTMSASTALKKNKERITGQLRASEGKTST